MIAPLSKALAFLALVASWASLADAQQVDVYFSPRGNVAAAIIAEIDNAATSVDVAAYQLSYLPLINALARASLRGVAVRVIVDDGLESNTPANLAAFAGSRVLLLADGREKIMHNKYAVIDRRTVVTGSFNWTNNAERYNAENLVIIRDPKTAARFAADFQKHLQHSRPFTAKQTPRHPANRPATSPPISFHPPTRKVTQPWHE